MVVESAENRTERPLGSFVDDSLIENLRVSGDDIRVYDGALKWAGGIAIFGETVRELSRNSKWGKRLSWGTRATAAVIGIGGFVARQLAVSSEDSVVDEIALRYSSLGHAELAKTISVMEAEGQRGAIKVGKVLDERM